MEQIKTIIALLIIIPLSFIGGWLANQNKYPYQCTEQQMNCLLARESVFDTCEVVYHGKPYQFYDL